MENPLVVALKSSCGKRNTNTNHYGKLAPPTPRHLLPEKPPSPGSHLQLPLFTEAEVEESQVKYGNL